MKLNLNINDSSSADVLSGWVNRQWHYLLLNCEASKRKEIHSPVSFLVVAFLSFQSFLKLDLLQEKMRHIVTSGGLDNIAYNWQKYLPKGYNEGHSDLLLPAWMLTCYPGCISTTLVRYFFFYSKVSRWQQSIHLFTNFILKKGRRSFPLLKFQKPYKALIIPFNTLSWFRNFWLLNMTAISTIESSDESGWLFPVWYMYHFKNF